MADITIYYMDIRTFGLYEDKFYWKSQEEFGTKFVKARIAEVTVAPDGKKLLVKGEDTLVKRPIVIPFDLVVHAIGMDPNEDNPEIARVVGVGLEHHGFVERGEHYTSSFASTRDRNPTLPRLTPRIGTSTSTTARAASRKVPSPPRTTSTSVVGSS